MKIVDAADNSDGEKEDRKRREDKGALETLGLGHPKYRREIHGLCFHGRRGKSPNDLKLSDGGAWRGSCEGGAQREDTSVEERHERTGRAQARVAATVTRGAVRCSAWLGHWFTESDS